MTLNKHQQRIQRQSIIPPTIIDLINPGNRRGERLILQSFYRHHRTGDLLSVMKAVAFSAVVFALACSAFSAEERPVPKPDQASHALEGTLKQHPKFLYRYSLAGVVNGENCALYGADDALGKIPVGTKVRVTGTLGTRRHEGGTEANPSPFPAMTYSFMDVAKVEVLERAAYAEDSDRAMVIAGQIAKGIEGLKGKFPHLADFSEQEHLRRNGINAGFEPGTPNNPELATIAYHHGVVGQRVPEGKGKRAAQDVFDPETGVRLYLHLFKGESRGADARPAQKIGDLSLNLYVTGPAAEAIRAEVEKLVESANPSER